MNSVTGGCGIAEALLNFFFLNQFSTTHQFYYLMVLCTFLPQSFVNTKKTFLNNYIFVRCKTSDNIFISYFGEKIAQLLEAN